MLSSGFLARQAPRVAERPPKEELDLAIDRAEVIRGPGLQGGECLLVQSQQEGLALRHQLVWPAALRLSARSRERTTYA